jgi:putative two-component system response regulator
MTDDAKPFLVVDDDPLALNLADHLLKKHGYACVFAGNAREARRRLDEQAFSLVLCDVNMPGESGMDLARYILSHIPGTAVVMVTAVDDLPLAEAALAMGAYGYIVKPFKPSELMIGVVNALQRLKLETELLLYQGRLERLVAERTATLEQTVFRLIEAEKKIRSSHEDTLHRLAAVAEFGAGETALHIQRVGRYGALLARCAGFDDVRKDQLRLASAMHDVGMVAVPGSVLRKPGPLTARELETVRTHADIGRRILSGSGEELLQMAATIAWTHHERMDGSGYPRGLKGDAIPVEGRIAAIADVFDAVTSWRPHRPALFYQRAFDLLLEGRGTLFDPTLLDAFIGSGTEVAKIVEGYADPKR